MITKNDLQNKGFWEEMPTTMIERIASAQYTEEKIKEEIKEKIRNIIEKYENDLCLAWCVFYDIDYDILSNSRKEVWDKLFDLITK